MATDAPAGLLLTGGRSSRMGRDKATLPWPTGSNSIPPRPAGGDPATTWARRAASLLAAVARPALEVGPGCSGLEVAPEPQPGGGPLLAVVAGWRALRSRCHPSPRGTPGRSGSSLRPDLAGAIVLACDLPALDPAVLSVLAARPPGRSAVPIVGGRPQWCCARYSPAALDAATSLAEHGRRDLASLGEDPAGIDWLGEDELGTVLASIADADTPADLLRLAVTAGVDLR